MLGGIEFTIWLLLLTVNFWITEEPRVLIKKSIKLSFKQKHCGVKVSEIKAFNRKLLRLMKPYKHGRVIRTDLDRKFFTKQCMNMNNLGKERMALEMANTAASILLKQE